MVDIPAGEKRAVAAPVLARAIGGEYECALMRADENSNRAHAKKVSRCPQLVERRFDRCRGRGLVPHEMLEVFPRIILVEETVWRKDVTEGLVFGMLGAE